MYFRTLWIGVMLVAAGGVVRGQDGAMTDGSVLPAGWHHRQSGVAPLFRPRQVPCYPECPPMAPTAPGSPGVPTEPTMPPAAPPDLSGLTTPFATGTEGGGLQGRSFNEAFDGDFGGVFYCRQVITGSRVETRQVGTHQEVRTVFRDGVPFRIVVTVPTYRNFILPVVQEALVPIPGYYSGISITDNDSPRPTDRFYFNYSYYDGIGAQMNPGIGNITQNRPTIGFEKTFLDGNASFGMRLPFVQVNGPPGAQGDTVGDLSMLTKFAFINNPNGDLVSSGLIITVPTAAREGALCDGSSIPRSVLFQPWVGFIQVFDRAYLQGISAVIVPTDSRDVTLFSNSLGFGYWLFRSDTDRLVRGIIPVFEAHIRTPLNHRDPNGLVFLQDQVNLTGGLHVRLPRATLGGAVSVPVVAPRPWNVEGIANFTYWF
jgi:hypothetical protein